MASKWRMGWVKEQHGEYGNHGNHGGKICIKGIRRGMRAAIIYYFSIRECMYVMYVHCTVIVM